jgi:excisionase family DNA binding protein
MKYTMTDEMAAREMGIPVKEIRAQITRGDLPTIQRGRGYLIRRADVFAAIDQRIALETAERVKAKQPEPAPETKTSNLKRGRKRREIPDLSRLTV